MCTSALPPSLRLWKDREPRLHPTGCTSRLCVFRGVSTVGPVSALGFQVCMGLRLSHSYCPCLNT